MSEPIRVVVADDHEPTRELLRIRFAFDGRLTVVGEAAAGDEALEVATAEQPDAVVVDLKMPGGGGLAVIPQLRAALPDTRIVVLSNAVALDQQTLSMTAGADAFLSKASELPYVIPTIVSLVTGR